MRKTIAYQHKSNISDLACILENNSTQIEWLLAFKKSKEKWSQIAIEVNSNQFNEKYIELYNENAYYKKQVDQFYNTNSKCDDTFEIVSSLCSDISNLNIKVTHSLQLIIQSILKNEMNLITKSIISNETLSKKKFNNGRVVNENTYLAYIDNNGMGITDMPDEYCSDENIYFAFECILDNIEKTTQFIKEALLNNDFYEVMYSQKLICALFEAELYRLVWNQSVKIFSKKIIEKNKLKLMNYLWKVSIMQDKFNKYQQQVFRLIKSIGFEIKSSQV